ncbi:MAG: DNA mismatch repair endonuclease MutL [Flavobacteriaceae bacterium]|jgi:DNA mismatch repair protein MutL|nr:DNA mismatch repair endonuclease MutL [Flavobacteriaceae bacterium]MDG1384170.1 DNA mismatch repair endonuclease MutL [Flavobacteriaceae bacterium]
MADIIQLLPDHVANQIAAGEVVQRPASVVKELLENAIDAGATTIKLLVKNAGKTLIQVIDDGKGMSVTDARLSFERHATSKIKVADDLFNLHTKGFRGEALASIAAIAHVEMKTKQASDELGTLLTIEGSVFTSQDVVATPKGSSIAVKNLFFNIPARRNFLKSDTVELRHIIDEFHRIVLAHPNLSFSMYHNGSDLFNLLKGNFRQRIVNTFGGKTNEKLVPVEETTEVLTISGFVGKPEYSKKSRGEQFFFVNNRFIKSPYLNHAISAAFEGVLQPGKQPSYFLNLKVDPKSIDINIHPTKTEIKFDDEQTIYAILRAAVKHSLGQFSIAPVLDFDRDKNLDTPYGFEGGQSTLPKVEVDRTFNPFSNPNQTPPSYSKPKTEAWEGLYVGLESKSNTDNVSQVNYESDEMTSSIFDDTTEKRVQKTFQLHNKYIINTIKSGMLVIDQNRAHERILYEEFLHKTTVNEAVSQQLLFPLQLKFSKSDNTILKDIQQALEATGFVFSAFTNESIVLTGLPVGVKESEVHIVFEQLIHDIEHEVPDVNFSISDLLSKTLAKSLAIKNGKKLEHEEQEHIVNSLFSCKEPSISPTNKTVFTTLKVEELDKKFN